MRDLTGLQEIRDVCRLCGEEFVIKIIKGNKIEYQYCNCQER